ncbi:hypothetical protein GOODEAATRI_006722 [Goodea atripinnis]|uniref:Uncharacterized protein n=1 Tax=Goodea atripinnis TaxID=208336 RepID=A0ABV0NI17_9TELE
MGRIGNLLSHLLLGLSSSLESVPLDQSTQGLLEASLRTVRALPVVPGDLFGSAALEALERTAQASRTRQQLAGLHRSARRPVDAGADGVSLSGSFGLPVPFLGSTSMAPRPRPARAQGDHGGAQALCPVRAINPIIQSSGSSSFQLLPQPAKPERRMTGPVVLQWKSSCIIFTWKHPLCLSHLFFRCEWMVT